MYILNILSVFICSDFIDAQFILDICDLMILKDYNTKPSEPIYDEHKCQVSRVNIQLFWFSFSLDPDSRAELCSCMPSVSEAPCFSSIAGNSKFLLAMLHVVYFY